MIEISMYSFFYRYINDIFISFIITCIKYKPWRNSHIAAFHFRSINIYVAISNQKEIQLTTRLVQDAMLDQTDNTYIFLCTIEDLLGSVWSFACNGVDVKKLSWICSTGNAYISINFSCSPSTPAAPSSDIEEPVTFSDDCTLLGTTRISYKRHLSACTRARMYTCVYEHACAPLWTIGYLRQWFPISRLARLLLCSSTRSPLFSFVV